MLRFLILYSICHFGACCLSQSAKQSLIAPYVKTGTYSINQADVFSYTTNQAALANATVFSAGVYSERKFMLNELNLFSTTFALPTKSGNFAVQLLHSGNSAFSETQGGIAYGRKLSDYIDVGVQFNYYTMQIAGYGRTAAINFEGGAILHFTDQLHGGIHVYNPTSSRIGKDGEERIPSTYSLGLGYDASDDFFVTTSIEKTEDEDLNVVASMQYKFADRFFARGGVVSATSVFFFGVGIKLERFRLDATASVHPQLGVTPGLMLVYTKPNKE